MNNKLIVGLFVVAGLFSSAASAWTVDSNRDFYDGANYSMNEDRDYLLATQYGGSYSSYNMGMFIKFDLSGITDTSVDQVFLTLESITSSMREGPTDIAVYNMAVDVGTAGENDAVGQMIGSAIDTVRVDSHGQYQWDITTLVNGWLDGSITNNGIGLAGVVYGNGSFDTVAFASSRNTDYDGPYISAVPEPSVLALMFGGLGLVGLMAYRSKKEVA